ncbi:MAG: hypothetical protein KGL39_29225 [Patescibacteria group bacterium]|nr:hypothetical protein [Patescibacteria group bacterium]
MAGFNGYDQIISSIVAGQCDDYWGVKVSGANTAAGVWHTTWLDSGFPGAGSAPAATPGTVYNGATNGSINFANQSPSQRYGLSVGATATQSMTLWVVDRLVAVSGLSTASTGSKTVSSSAIAGRYTSGAGVQAWLEVTTATTTTAPVVHLLSYTNQAGSTGQVGAQVTFPAAATKLGDMIQLPLQAGDSGVQAVSTLNVDTASSAGAVNLVLLKPLAAIPLVASQWNERDLVLQLAALPRIFDGANLMLMFQNTGTTAPTINFRIFSAYN